MPHMSDFDVYKLVEGDPNSWGDVKEVTRRYGVEAWMVVNRKI